MERRLKAVVLGGALFVGTVAIGHSAMALPTGCSLDTTTRSVSAHCSGGTGYYRAAGKVRWTSGAYSYIYGSWQRPGWSESYVNAPSGSVVVAGYLQKK